MSHPLVLALYDDAAGAAAGARAVHAVGVPRDRLSIVARNHEVEGDLAEQLEGTPGADIEDSRSAGVLGELGAHLLAVIAVVLPGTGALLSAGPLSAAMGEAAGHVAGSVESVLEGAGVSQSRAHEIAQRVTAGAVLLGVHVPEGKVEAVRRALGETPVRELDVARWDDSLGGQDDGHR
jgi:hypothetical protein